MRVEGNSYFSEAVGTAYFDDHTPTHSLSPRPSKQVTRNASPYALAHPVTRPTRRPTHSLIHDLFPWIAHRQARRGSPCSPRRYSSFAQDSFHSPRPRRSPSPLALAWPARGRVARLRLVRSQLTTQQGSSCQACTEPLSCCPAGSATGIAFANPIGCATAIGCAFPIGCAIGCA